MREKMFRATQVFGVLGCLLMLMVVGSAQATVIIDTFNVTNQTVDTDPGSVHVPGPLNVATAGGEAIGGSRTMQIVKDSGSLQARLDANPGGSQTLTLSNDAGVKSTSKITWDSNGAGLGGIDLTEEGLSTFLSFNVVDIDFGGISLLFTVKDTAANTATRLIPDATVGTFQAPFTSFTDYSLDLFQDVDFVSLEISTVVASKDLELDFIYTSGPIPEPSSLILLGVGILGMVSYGWARRKKAAA